MVCVNNGVFNNVLEKFFKHSTGLFVDETGDTLDTTTTSETADSRLGNTINCVAEDLAVALGTSLPKTLASFSPSGHVDYSVYVFYEELARLEI